MFEKFLGVYIYLYSSFFNSMYFFFPFDLTGDPTTKFYLP